MYGLIEIIGPWGLSKHDAAVSNNNAVASNYIHPQPATVIDLRIRPAQYWLSSQPALKPNHPGLEARMIWVRAQVSLILEDLSSQGCILTVQDKLLRSRERFVD